MRPLPSLILPFDFLTPVLVPEDEKAVILLPPDLTSDEISIIINELPKDDLNDVVDVYQNNTLILHDVPIEDLVDAEIPKIEDIPPSNKTSEEIIDEIAFVLEYQDYQELVEACRRRRFAGLLTVNTWIGS